MKIVGHLMWKSGFSVSFEINLISRKEAKKGCFSLRKTMAKFFTFNCHIFKKKKLCKKTEYFNKKKVLIYFLSVKKSKKYSVGRIIHEFLTKSTK